MEGSEIEGGQMEWESHHWLLRGGGWGEAVAATNCAGAARAHSVCVTGAQ